MAVTHGHGNPPWTRDETILALELYFECAGHIPSPADPRVTQLSDSLRAFPYHSQAARRESFRNPAGVAFKLQNLRQVATGRGLANVSAMDRKVWADLGEDPERIKEIADLIRRGLIVTEEEGDPTPDADEEFAEGRVVTEAHKRRERSPHLRKRLLDSQRKRGALKCELCEIAPSPSPIGESIFEVHHLVPLGIGPPRKTRLSDVALLCANCHRLVHRAISWSGRWLSLAEVEDLMQTRGEKWGPRRDGTESEQ